MNDELTEVDIKKMQEEIDYRMHTLRPKLIKDLQAARELGDLSENDEYHTAKRELNRNYSRINYLKQMINTAIVIKDKSTEDTVGLFDKVTLYYEEDNEERVISIVTTLRNDVLLGLISKESPFGKAILGRKNGERVRIDVDDDYSYYVVIKGIEKGHDDESMQISSF